MMGRAQDAKLCAGRGHVPAAFISIPPRMTFALRAAIGSLRCHGPREAIERPDKQQNRYQGNGNVYGAAHFCSSVAEAVAPRRFQLGAPVAQIPVDVIRRAAHDALQDRQISERPLCIFEQRTDLNRLSNA